MSNGQKISQFNSQNALNDSDLVTIVRNGQNFNISFSDLKAELGVTGNIGQVGDPLGVPILSEPVESNYLIKNLESNKGVIAGESPGGGALIGANFTQGAAGVSLISDLNADQYLFRSLQAGDGINISSTGSSIQISAVDAVVSSKTVIISVESDFPDPVLGVITLEPDTSYLLLQDITTSNRFIFQQNTTMSGTGVQNITIAYTGTDYLFTASNATTAWQNLVISAPSGSVWNWSSSVQAVFRAFDVVIGSCDSIGLLNSDGFSAAARVTNVSLFNIESNGITFTGEWLTFLFEVSFSSINSGSLFDLGAAVFNTIVIDAPIINLETGSSLISGMADSGNISVGGVGVVTRAITSGAGEPLIGITYTDTRWFFAINSSIPNSISDGLMYTYENPLETVILNTVDSVKVNAVFDVSSVSKFEFDAGGRLTYVGEVGVKLPLDITSTILVSGGGDKQVGVCIAINGAEIPQTRKVGTASSSKAASITTIWQHEFSTGDYIEAFAFNETDLTNVIAQQVTVRVN